MQAAKPTGLSRPVTARIAGVAAGLLCLLAGTSTALASGRGRDPARPPNVITIVTDDQSMASFRREYMPHTFDRLVDGGTWFRDFVVSTPLCCPSRAAYATGQYGHNNGVLTNFYERLRRRRNVLPNWLRRVGYRTFHVGRFFNGYEGDGRELVPAPGWDVWRTALMPRTYYDYDLTFNHGIHHFGTGDNDQLTVVLNRIATRIVARRAPMRRPFYLQLDQFAPHDGPGSRAPRCDQAAVPGPEDEDAYAGAIAPRTPAFDEADISDKPAFMQGLPPMSVSDRAEIDRKWGCTLASLLEVDRGVGAIWKALHDAHALRETAIVLTSDNGFLFGQHRIAGGRKQYPYEEALRVPLVVRLPPRLGPQAATSRAPAANIDLAPTILDLAGGEPCNGGVCRTLDGRSLLGTMLGANPLPADRGVLLEYDAAHPVNGLVCTYTGIRTGKDVLIDHSRARADEQQPCGDLTASELYDRAADPFQLQSLFPPAPGSLEEARLNELQARLAVLSDCAGIAGRDPLPPSGHYCE